jgi:hypothetical protein
VNFTAHFHLVLRLRMKGANPTTAVNFLLPRSSSIRLAHSLYSQTSNHKYGEEKYHFVLRNSVNKSTFSYMQTITYSVRTTLISSNSMESSFGPHLCASYTQQKHCDINTISELYHLPFNVKVHMHLQTSSTPRVISY